MNTLPPEPSAKDPISASFVKALMRYIRSNTLLNGTGYKTNRGPNGTTLVIKPSSSTSSSRLPGCFEYGGTVDESGNKFYGRPYFTVGSRLYRAKDEDVACGESEGIDYLDVTLEKGQIKSEVNHVATYAALQEKADDKNHAIIPLYEFGANGKPVADLRNIPTLSAWEFST